MRRIEARRRNASAFRLRFAKSLANLRQRPSHEKVRSTTQRRGRTSKPLAASERLTISVTNAGQGFLLRGSELRSLVTAVREQLLQKWEFSEHRAQKKNAAIAILNVGGMNERMKQQAYRIDENMPFLALDLFSCIVAVWIDARPPFSALFTLWLSMTAAVGLASRPAASRHVT